MKNALANASVGGLWPYFRAFLYFLKNSISIFVQRSKAIAGKVPQNGMAHLRGGGAFSYNYLGKILRIFPGGLPPPGPPIWACWGRPRGGYRPWGYYGSLLERRNIFLIFFIHAWIHPWMDPCIHPLKDVNIYTYLYIARETLVIRCRSVVVALSMC